MRVTIAVPVSDSPGARKAGKTVVHVPCVRKLDKGVSRCPMPFILIDAQETAGPGLATRAISVTAPHLAPTLALRAWAPRAAYTEPQWKLVRRHAASNIASFITDASGPELAASIVRTKNWKPVIAHQAFGGEAEMGILIVPKDKAPTLLGLSGHRCNGRYWIIEPPSWEEPLPTTLPHVEHHKRREGEEFLPYAARVKL